MLELFGPRNTSIPNTKKSKMEHPKLFTHFRLQEKKTIKKILETS